MILTCIALCLYVLLIIIKKDLIDLPIKIISLWYLALLALATFSTTGLYPPSLHTQIICLTMIVGFNAAVFLKESSWFKVQTNPEVMEKSLRLLFTFSAILQFILVIFYFGKSIFMLMEIKDPSTYKVVAFSTTEAVGKLFESRMIENLYFLISSPLLLFTMIYGIAVYIGRNQVWPFVIGLFLSTMDGTMRLARINIYCAIVLLIFMLLLKKRNALNSWSSKLKPLIIIALVGAMIVGIGSRRRYNLANQIELFLVDYHTVGFTLFDLEVKNPESVLNKQMTYGRLFFGGLETIGTIGIRQFDKNYMSPALNNAIVMGENRITGVEKVPSITFKGIKRHNSFYTILYTLYSDGRYIGLFLGGLVIGWFLKLYYRRWLADNSTYSLLWVILITNTMIFSVFISQLEIMRTWMLIIGFWLLEFIMIWNKKRNLF